MKITAYDLIHAINQLPRDRYYHYINPKTKGIIRLVRVDLPSGPIIIKRFDPAKGETEGQAKEESISPQMVWRIANAFIPSAPLNVDRVLGASYNTRSVLEALIAHTPMFYYSYPGRIENIDSTTKIKSGHKHIMWIPDKPHGIGVLERADTEVVISEIPNMDVVYDSVVLPEAHGEPGLDIDIKRRHAQIQIALVMIGIQLGFRNWVAQNDKAIVYKGKKVGEIEGVIVTLNKEALIAGFPEAVKSALLIDCIWFKNHRLMPAVMEIEHTTGVTSGLTRMKNFQDILPPFPSRYVIVAPDEDKEKVLQEANKEQFKSLNTRFFPYSAVEELYSLCQRRKLKGVTEEFLDCFMESAVLNGSKSISVH